MGDPSRFVPQPANVAILPFLAHGELRTLLPHVDLCINHAGYGSVMDALLYGIPLVLLPLTSDGPMNTQMCLSTGVTPELPSPAWGISPKGLPVVRPEKLTPFILRQAVIQALEDPTYRAAARRMQAELAARPGLKRVLRCLSALRSVCFPPNPAISVAPAFDPKQTLAEWWKLPPLATRTVKPQPVEEGGDEEEQPYGHCQPPAQRHQAVSHGLGL